MLIQRPAFHHLRIPMLEMYVTGPPLTVHQRVCLRTFSTLNFSPKNALFPTFFVILMAEEGATFSKLRNAEMKANPSGNPAAHNASFVSMQRLSTPRSTTPEHAPQQE